MPVCKFILCRWAKNGIRITYLCSFVAGQAMAFSIDMVTHSSIIAVTLLFTVDVIGACRTGVCTDCSLVRQGNQAFENHSLKCTNLWSVLLRCVFNLVQCKIESFENILMSLKIIVKDHLPSIPWDSGNFQLLGGSYPGFGTDKNWYNWLHASRADKDRHT